MLEDLIDRCVESVENEAQLLSRKDLRADLKLANIPAFDHNSKSKIVSSKPPKTPLRNIDQIEKKQGLHANNMTQLSGISRFSGFSGASIPSQDRSHQDSQDFKNSN